MVCPQDSAQHFRANFAQLCVQAGHFSHVEAIFYLHACSICIQILASSDTTGVVETDFTWDAAWEFYPTYCWHCQDQSDWIIRRFCLSKPTPQEKNLCLIDSNLCLSPRSLCMYSAVSNNKTKCLVYIASRTPEHEQET